MPRFIKEESQKELTVYVILSEQTKEFFVWKVKKTNCYQAYKNHVHGKTARTKDFFLRCVEEEKFPKMYLLEDLKTTDRTAFSYCVAWTKYFMDHGFTSLSAPKFLEYTSKLTAETKIIFESICNAPLAQVLSDEHLLVANYKKKSAEKIREPKDAIRVTVSEKEYITIQKKADKVGLSMSRYCKNMALSGQIVILEEPSLSEYLAEIRGAKVILRQILYAIYQNKKYYPADLANIQKMVDRINGDELKILEATNKNMEVIRRLLPK